MGKFIDFAEIRERLPIDEVARMLSNKVKWKETSNRLDGRCPIHGGEIVVTPSAGLFNCTGSLEDKTGGDCIGLYAHIMQMRMYDAAKALAEKIGMLQSSTVKSTSNSDSTVGKKQATPPKNEKAGANPPTNLENIAARLQSEHEAVSAVGFDTEIAKELGIGYDPKGFLRGYVAIPIRTVDGELKGFIGIKEAKIPSDLSPKIISLKRA
jgi:DNA primase